VIANSERITQKELSDILLVDKSTTAKAVNSLVSQGYIKKRACTKDNRFRKLYLTEKGQSIKPKIQKTFLESLDITTNTLNRKEI